MINTEIFIEGRRVDLGEDVKIPVNLGLTDIKDINTRKTEFTKTVKLLGTTNNMKVFGDIFDITVSNGFNAKRKARASILTSDSIVINGYVQLLDIQSLGENVTFEVVFYGTLGDLISNLGEKEIADIEDGQELSHEYSLLNVYDSWELDLPFKYPLADYGVNNIFEHRKMNVAGLFPSVKLKWYIDKIFKEAGYVYKSNFFNSKSFDSIYIPYNGDGRFAVDERELRRREFSATRDVPVMVQFPSTNFTNDPLRQTYIPNSFTGGETLFEGADYVVPATGVYTFSSIVDILTSASSSVGSTQGVRVDDGNFHRLRVILEVIDSEFQPKEITALGGWRRTVTDNNTQNLLLDDDTDEGAYFDLFGTLGFLGTGSVNIYRTVANRRFTLEARRISLNAGDRVRLRFEYDFNTGDSGRFQTIVGGDPVNGGARFTIVENGQHFNTASDEIGVGVELPFDIIGLRNIKQRDLLISTLRVFNLVVVPDEDRPNGVLVMTKDEYYNEGKTKDWTDKLDLSKPVNIQPVNDRDIAEYIYRFNNSNDYFNQLYLSNNGRVYGELRVDNENDFGAEQRVNDNIFEPAVVVKNQDNTIRNIFVKLNSDDTDLTLFDVVGIERLERFTGITQFASINGQDKVIVSLDGNTIEVDSPVTGVVADTLYATTIENRFDREQLAIYSSGDGNLSRRPIQTKPKMVLFSKLKECEEYVLTDGLESMTLEQYPYFSHLNKPSDEFPTFDLNFGRPNTVYFDIDSYPTDNIFERFHSNSLREMSSPDSRVVTAYFNLSPLDVAKIRYNDLIYIKGVYYRINRIIDFDLNSNEPAKVELFKLDRTFNFLPENAEFIGEDFFKVININLTEANTSNYIIIDSEDLFEPFQPTNREFAYYELTRNVSDFFENFANGTNVGEFTFGASIENIRFAQFNGVDQYFETDEEFTSRGLIGATGSNDNTVGVWFGFETLPVTDKFIWIASNADQSTYTGLKYVADTQRLEYIRFNDGTTNFVINNVLDEFTITYNGTVAEEGDQFIYDGNTYDIVGVEPNVIYFLPALVGYTGDATPFQGQPFTLVKNPVNSVVVSQTQIQAGTAYTTFCRYDHANGVQELWVDNVLQDTIINQNILPIPAFDTTRIRLGFSPIEGYTEMSAGRFRVAGVYLDTPEILRLGTKAVFRVFLRSRTTGVVTEIPQEWVVIVTNEQIGFNIPPDFPLGEYILWFGAGGIESKRILFRVLDIDLRMTPLSVRFDNESALNNNFEALNKGWGGANGGVVASSVYIGDDGTGTTALVLESHGDLYTGNVQGVDNRGNLKFNPDGTPWTKRKGACVLSKQYLGYGRYEAEARVVPKLGVCSAFWNFHYQEIYPTDPRWEQYIKDVIVTDEMQPNLRAQFLLNNNVNSASGLDSPTWTITDPSNTSYTTGVKSGSAIRYNGSTGWAHNIAGVQTLGSFDNPFTVSFWCKVNLRAGNNNRHNIISNGTSNNGAWGVQVFYSVDEPEFQLVGKVTGSTVVGTNNPNKKPYGTWQHFVMVNNPATGKMQLYIDGILAQDVNAPVGTYSDAGWWRIIQTTVLSGGGAGAATRDIEVADVRFLSRAVGQLEARVMYGRPYFVGNPDFEGLGLRPIGNEEDGFYIVRNNEIDIEIPSQLEGGIIDEPSILNGKFNTWRGEYQNWDVDKSDPTYWEEYRDNYRPMGIDVTDGQYHKFRYDWYHDRVEFYIDDNLIITNYNYQFGYDSYNIPDVIGKYTMGNWFPSGNRFWAGKNADFDVEYMYVKQFDYTPFVDEINEHQVIVGETYPRDGIVDLSAEAVPQT